ncbi:MAG: hypothetical protein ACE14S_08930 [Candidatus Bathyarchaeia archaeon]
MKKKETDPLEPHFYVALVLKGTEQQYLDLLKYVANSNGAQVIYQCKSLTYLRVTRDDGVKVRPVSPELDAVENVLQGGETA